MKNKLVHCLWIGKELQKLELLTIESFLDMGADLILWHYSPIKNKLPKKIKFKDANEILPESSIFTYPENTYVGFGGGSFAGFADVFRYKALYEYGGWWTDMDVTCLRPIEEVKDDYWFRFHGVHSVVGNIIKCPAKSRLMKLCFDKAFKEVNGQQRDWHHGIRILCYYIQFLNLSKYINYEESNLDRLDFLDKFISESSDKIQIPSKWRFIHWMNTLVNKNCLDGSVLSNFYKKYKLKKDTSNIML
jgi:hypothetical protein